MSKQLQLLGLACLVLLAGFQAGCASTAVTIQKNRGDTETVDIHVDLAKDFVDRISVSPVKAFICYDPAGGANMPGNKCVDYRWKLNWIVHFDNAEDMCGTDPKSEQCYVIVGGKDRKGTNGKIYPRYSLLMADTDNNQGKPKPPVYLGRNDNKRRFEYFIEAYKVGTPPTLIGSYDPEVMPHKGGGI